MPASPPRRSAGTGNFSDTRLGMDVKHSPEMVTSKLPALRAYRHSLPVPLPPAGSSIRQSQSVDEWCLTERALAATLARRAPITTAGHCTRRRDTGVDGAYAARTANKAYRTTPLRDYGDVCQSITDLALQLNAPINVEDFRTLNRCLDDAIASAVTEHGRGNQSAVDTESDSR